MSDIEENNSNLEDVPLVKKTKKPRTEKQIQQFKEALKKRRENIEIYKELKKEKKR